MARRSTVSDDETPEINLSPMIDCIFILLIFFIVTTVFVEESGLQLNKPEAGGSGNSDNEKIQIDITAENKVLFEGLDIGVSGVSPLLKRRLERPDTPVLISAHEQSSHGVFARVWGEASTSGAEKLAYQITK